MAHSAQSKAMETNSPAQSAALAQEEMRRAYLYRLLAHFLARPPRCEALHAAAQIAGDDSAPDDSPLGQALSAFAHRCALISAAEAAEEYNALFIGLPRGELLPYASYYLTGFLHEEPLARLRADLARLRIERAPSVSEPEDHIAALLDVMGGLIAGDFGAPAPLAQQKQFFTAHLSPWAPYFFADLERAKSAVLYAPLGAIGRLLMETEAVAFTMIAEDTAANQDNHNNDDATPEMDAGGANETTDVA